MSKRVLFIDDEPYFQSIYGNRLIKAGYSVEFAGNGEEALALMKRHAFDVLIVDLIMPIMSGLRFLEKIKSKIKKLDIVCLTTLDSVTDQMAIEKLGVKHFYTKTDVEPARLVEIIKTL